MKRRATLKDVAKVAGVHLSTVSRALNPRTQHLLTRKVVEQIRTISRDLDYRPNAAAHSLRTNRTRTIGVVVPDITNPVFPPIIRGIEDALAKRGYVAILANTDGHIRHEAEIAGPIARPRRRWSHPRECRARGRGGLAARGRGPSNRHCEPAGRRSRRLVRGERRGRRHPRRASSTLRRSAIARSPTSLARRRCPPASSATRRSRRTAAHSGSAAARARRVCGGLQRGGGLPAHRGITASKAAGFTAIVCANDRLAIGALAALRQHGLDCPDNISVTGYNDMPLVDRLSPALTTVRIQQYEVGLEAADILVEMIGMEPDKRSPRHSVHPVKLIVRESTAPPPAVRKGNSERRMKLVDPI